jgi:hypothetical protein
VAAVNVVHKHVDGFTLFAPEGQMAHYPRAQGIAFTSVSASLDRRLRPPSRREAAFIDPGKSNVHWVVGDGVTLRRVF